MSYIHTSMTLRGNTNEEEKIIKNNEIFASFNCFSDHSRNCLKYVHIGYSREKKCILESGVFFQRNMIQERIVHTYGTLL